MTDIPPCPRGESQTPLHPSRSRGHGGPALCINESSRAAFAHPTHCTEIIAPIALIASLRG